MPTVDKLIPQAHGLAPALLKRAATVSLGWDRRQDHRFQAEDSDGRALDVVLAPGTVVRGGDVLVADDGSLVKVVAAPQPVLVVRTCPEHGTPADLLRAAYRLGERGVAVEVGSGHLKLDADPALADELRGMRLVVDTESSPFEPRERVGPHGRPAHAAARTIPIQGAARPVHVHGPGCGHDHGHPHSHP